MAIHALPQSTIHLLGSAQALTTSTSLVKELIDNSLDAKATSVEILISQNTLDKIQVRDNGRGIPLEDLDALGRRGHTSKLTNFEELRTVGGTTLGFRGEALASAVQLGEVSVTTRTDGEAVATTAVLKALGGVARQSRTSHPVGTTICVLNFMYKLPVRKQTALKSSSKTLVKVKELLQAYALARPSIRFSLKVLKESKGGFSYAPRPSDGIKEAVSHVIGKDASAQCVEKSFVFSESQPTGIVQVDGGINDTNQVPNSQFHVSIYLPRPDADPSKIGRGQFLSIDARPVSHDKGTMKRIVTLFKGYLKVALGENADIKNPFLRFDIRCPVASYDPNVEPAKDDVLFGSEAFVLDSFESFFKGLYGEKSDTPAAALRSNLTRKLDDFEILLARKPAVPSQPSAELPASELSVQPKSLARESSTPAVYFFAPNSPLLTSHPPAFSMPDKERIQKRRSIEDSPAGDVGNSRRRWDFDISKDFVEGDTTTDISSKSQKRNVFRPQAQNASPQPALESTGQLNPWVIAKMTAPVQPSAAHNGALQATSSSSLTNPQQQPPSSIRSHFSNPTPLADTQEQPASPPRLRQDGSLEPDLLVESPNRIRSQPRRRQDSLGLPDLLPQPQPQMSISHTREQPAFQRPQNDFISARNMSETMPLSPPVTQKRRAPKRSNGLDKPFVPPRRVADETEPSTSLRQTTLSVPQGQNVSSRGIERGDEISELDWAMAYEQNKELATQQLREERRIARKEAKEKEKGADKAYEICQSSPHKNRQNAAIAALDVENFVSLVKKTTEQEPARVSLPRNDPRSYLMRQQELTAVRGGPSKLTRAKSMKLPLEKIPDKSQTTGLVLKHSSGLNDVQKLAQVMAGYDRYVARGIQECGLGCDVSSKKDIFRKFQVVVEEWMAKGDTECEVDYKFQNLHELRAPATI